MKEIISNLWLWMLNEHVLSGFLVTMLGVLAAFFLAGLYKQHCLNKATKQRLQLAILESHVNSYTANVTLNRKMIPGQISVPIKRFRSVAALAAYQDTNIMSVLPLSTIVLLGHYVSDINTLNRVMDLYIGTLESVNYKETAALADVRRSIHSNAKALEEIAVFLREKLIDYSDPKLYNTKEMKETSIRVNFIKEKATKSESPQTEKAKDEE